jgi:hypothetical protein
LFDESDGRRAVQAAQRLNRDVRTTGPGGRISGRAVTTRSIGRCWTASIR